MDLLILLGSVRLRELWRPVLCPGWKGLSSSKHTLKNEDKWETRTLCCVRTKMQKDMLRRVEVKGANTLWL